jgi:YHS domain-containing protein
MGIILFLSVSIFSISNAQSKEPAKEKTKSGMQVMDHMNHEMNINEKEEKPWNEVCPVRGADVDTEVDIIKFNGKNYGFCCGGCDSKFKKNPEKYSKNLSDDGKRFIGKKS